MNFGLSFYATIFAATFLLGCSSNIVKTKIDASANPNDEILRVETEINQASRDQLDVLDSQDLNSAKKYLSASKNELASGQEQSKILNDVGYADAYVKRAQSLAAKRRIQIPAIIGAREKALVAGALSQGTTKEDFNKIDNELRSKADDLNKVSPDEQAQFQSKYLGLQYKAIIGHQLGTAISRINAAKEFDAEKYTPKTLKKAEVDLATAKNDIHSNVDQESLFNSSVQQADASALTLSRVLAASKSGQVDEETAMQLVTKDQKIAALNGNLESNESKSEKMQTDLKNKNQQLVKADSAIGLQKSIESARTQFTKDEADVYQQGGNLVIRLKKLNFASGKAELPPSALPILAKVRDVAVALNPSNLVVEGRSDSVGSKQLNEKLSLLRANSVAEYFSNNGLEKTKMQTKGLGFGKPTSSNKSKEGREENRSVDIIVTPTDGSSIQ